MNYPQCPNCKNTNGKDNKCQDMLLVMFIEHVASKPYIGKLYT